MTADANIFSKIVTIAAFFIVGSAIIISFVNLDHYSDINCFCGDVVHNKLLAILLSFLLYIPSVYMYYHRQEHETYGSLFFTLVLMIYFSVVFHRVATEKDINSSCFLDTTGLSVSFTLVTPNRIDFTPQLTCEQYMEKGGMQHVSNIFIVQLILFVFHIIFIISDLLTNKDEFPMIRAMFGVGV